MDTTNKIKFYIASDHAGYKLKQELQDALIKYNVIDLGTHNDTERVDYPEFAGKLCDRILDDSKNNSDPSYGILICGSGLGMSMVANRFKGIRGALCRSEMDGKLAKEHNDANVICFGERYTTIKDAINVINAWEQALFLGGRHSERIASF